MVADIRSLAEQGAAAGMEVTAVGVGLPGLVTATGRLQASAHVPHAEGVDVRGALHAALALPVAVDNDATCAALAEWRLGAARSFDDVVLVAVGTGIGSGVVAGGQLVRGWQNFAGEAGHMVVDPTGPWCPCGRRGCWERYASGERLGERGRRVAARGGAQAVTALAGGDAASVRGEHVVAAAAAGDGDARAVVAELAWWLAVGIANLSALLDSRRIVIGGGLADAGETVIGPLRAALRDPRLLGRGRTAVEVVPAGLGSWAGAVGAALLAGEAATVPSSASGR